MREWVLLSLGGGCRHYAKPCWSKVSFMSSEEWRLFAALKLRKEELKHARRLCLGSGLAWALLRRVLNNRKTMSISKIPETVSVELQRQFNHELAAAHAYQAMSVWCAVRTLKGFAEFFQKQAGEEREHAEKIMKHLLDRGAQPILEAVGKPIQDFEGLMALALRAQAMEQANTMGINAVYEAAFAAKDYPAQVLMHWFISEQVEEEAWCAELIDRVSGATCAGGLAELDRHIMKYLAGD